MNNLYDIFVNQNVSLMTSKTKADFKLRLQNLSNNHLFADNVRKITVQSVYTNKSILSFVSISDSGMLSNSLTLRIHEFLVLLSASLSTSVLRLYYRYQAVKI